MTLIEVVVAMSIMSVIMAVVTGGLVQMFRVTSTTQTRSIAQSEVGRAMLRLDRQVRYASGISEPRVTGNGMQYVEYLFVETGRSTCVQLRVSGDRLQQRSWTSGSFRPTAWGTLASGVTTPRPFHRVDATDNHGHQRLNVVLGAAAGRGTAALATETVSFTALNTNQDSPAEICTEGV